MHWVGGSGSILLRNAGSPTGRVQIIGPSNVAVTVMRIRGSLTTWLDDEAATLVPGDVVHCAVGMIVEPGGLAAVTQSPITDAQAPWWYYERFHLVAETASSDLAQGGQFYRSEIDVKAMRIVRADQEIGFVVEIADIAQTSTVNFMVTARFLVAV